LPKKIFDFAAIGFVGKLRRDHLLIALLDRQHKRVGIERGIHARQVLLQHEHHEQAFLGPFRIVPVDRGAGPDQGKNAVMRERFVSVEDDVRQGLRAQSLDRITIDLADRDHNVAGLSHRAKRRASTAPAPFR
jgi:hypothetical protein